MFLAIHLSKIILKVSFFPSKVNNLNSFCVYQVKCKLGANMAVYLYNFRLNDAWKCHLHLGIIIWKLNMWTYGMNWKIHIKQIELNWNWIYAKWYCLCGHSFEYFLPNHHISYAATLIKKKKRIFHNGCLSRLKKFVFSL